MTFPWRYTGTASQIAMAKEAVARIKYPWPTLARITWHPELGWRDLNSRYLEGEARAHGKFEGEEGQPEPLNGELEGRRFTYAVFYPGSGRIYIDYRLERYPALAHASVSAELAHAVDEFLPLRDAQRDEIIRLLGGTPGVMTWWEKHSYSTEYWGLAGEMFMPLFTNAYSDIPFGDVSGFSHDPNKVHPDDLIRVIGVQRTDWVAPTPPAPPPPPEPIIEPEAVIEPVPEPPRFLRYGKSKVYHSPAHYPNKKNGVPVETVDGLRRCKRCLA